MKNLTDRAIELFLNKIKEEGRSSPSGMHWHEFFVLLNKCKGHGEPDPPVPLILAASVESNASKYYRLTDQLEWALHHGCLEEALAFLNNLDLDKWNTGTPDGWNKSYY